MKLLITLGLLGLAALLFIIATLIAAGAVTMSGGNWLLPGGLAALAVAFFVWLLPAAPTAP